MDRRALVPKGKPIPGDPAGTLDLIGQLARESAAWAEAELALARAESGVVMRRAVAGIVALLGSFAAMIAALVSLAQAAAAAITPLVAGPAQAGFLVCLGLAAMAIALGFIARRFFASPRPRPSSVILAWVLGGGQRGSAVK